ncbi:F-box/WD repeat-containing protein 7-like [Oopsacas minuta]|uniref:F-box/WD repeat-containing protein 7-like n=1 Tax=Oopsacas minuta TaxID=111878 RepID=A0AAV7K0I9_9METZ|nr:F-box/WD repeat-containing protein 7-like [Oopsacas minuta]
MKAKSTEFISPRSERFKNRQLRQELADLSKQASDTSLISCNDIDIKLECPTTPCCISTPILSPCIKPARSKRRDTCRGTDTPSQLGRAKKRREDKRTFIPVIEAKTELVVTREEIKIIPEVEDWVRSFEQFSNSKQSLALSMLVPRCQPVRILELVELINPQLCRDFITNLPRELSLKILSYLAPEDLLIISLTSRQWYIMCSDLLLWKNKCNYLSQYEAITDSNALRKVISSTSKLSSHFGPQNKFKQLFLAKKSIQNNWRNSDKPPKILKGHDDSVITCLQVKKDLIVSGSDDNTLKLWSISSLKCVHILNGHTGGVWCSEFDGSIVVSGSTDRNLRVWDARNGNCVHVLEGHTSTVRCVSLCGNTVVSGSRDSSIRIWNVKSGKCVHVLNGHTAAVRCVKYNGEFVVSGGYDWTVKVWSPKSAECLHTLQGHANRVYSLEFDGEHIISGSLDTIIKVWDVRTGNLLHDLVGHRSLTSSMSLRDKILVSGNADSTVKIWDTGRGELKLGLQGKDMHKSAVTCVQLVDPFIVTSSDDGTVKLWDLTTGEFVRNLIQLKSQGSGGVVWRIFADQKRLVAAVGSRHGTEETRLVIMDFDL